MAISLTEIIAALEAKSNTTDSSSSISDILNLTRASEAISDGAILYDSASVMPTDSAFIGTLAATSAGTIYLYNGTSWRAADSAEPVPVPLPHYQGTSYGYGGTSRFSLASDENGTTVATASTGVYGPYSDQYAKSGNSSSTNAYQVFSTAPTSSIYYVLSIIDKFPFAQTSGTASDVGNLSVERMGTAGSSSETYGYSSGGWKYSDPSPGTMRNEIDKFPFSSDGNAADVGDATVAKYARGGTQSETYGYTHGGGGYGLPAPLQVNVIEKFSFSADGNATDVGDLTTRNYGPTGQASDVSGYSSGGKYGGGGGYAVNTINKYSFSADGNATDVGDITVSRTFPGGSNSATSGYTAAGRSLSPPGVSYNTIDKFPFSTDANASDVGDLSVSGGVGAGHQV